MKRSIFTLAPLCALLSAAPLNAQLTDYLGPAILTRGGNNIGSRGGSEDVNIRPYVNVSGFADNGLLAIGVDENGQLIDPGVQYGVQAGFGAYGRHNFRRSVLGLDYNGNYRHFTANRFFNGTNHQLALNYTHQLSRRFVIQAVQTAGTVSQGNAFLGTAPNGVITNVQDSVVDPTTLLFDNRSNYLQSSMSASFLLSARTSFTAGGSGYLVRRRSRSLVGLNGWQTSGSIDHRLTQRTTVGASYQHRHVDFPDAFGETNIDILQGSISHALNQFWTISFSGGALRVETQGLQRVAPDPAIAALFGNTPTIRTFYRRNILPQINVSISRQFRNARLSGQYARSVNNGNGVFLTSRMETISASYALQGRRKWALTFGVGYTKLNSIGQDLSPFNQIYGTATLNYSITPVLSLSVTGTTRRQEIRDGLNNDGERLAIGLSFSPAGIPLSLY